MDEWQLKIHFIRFPDSPRTWSLPLASSPTDLLQGGGHLSTCPSSSERSHPACGLGYHGSAERRAGRSLPDWIYPIYDPTALRAMHLVDQCTVDQGKLSTGRHVSWKAARGSEGLPAARLDRPWPLGPGSWSPFSSALRLPSVSVTHLFTSFLLSFSGRQFLLSAHS